MKFKLIISDTPWGEYKHTICKTTDCEKFEDMLKMVISCDRKSYEKFNTFLQICYEKNELNYGIHIADTSLMTCLVFERCGSQVHFVDSANGGYAMAAKAFKKRAQKLT